VKRIGILFLVIGVGGELRHGGGDYDWRQRG
jgi:hypothetical protein